MNFIENLFVDNNIKDFSTVIYALKKGVAVYNIYVIFIDENSNSLAQIMSSACFLKLNTNKNFKIIGVSSGEKGAQRLFSGIIEYCVKEGVSICDFKEFIIKE